MVAHQDGRRRGRAQQKVSELTKTFLGWRMQVAGRILLNISQLESAELYTAQ